MLMLVAWGIQISVELWGLPDIAAYCGSLGDSGPATVQESDACGIAREIANSRTNAARGIFELASVSLVVRRSYPFQALTLAAPAT